MPMLIKRQIKCIISCTEMESWKERIVLEKNACVYNCLLEMD